MKQDKILDKIKKLLELSKNNPSEEEASSALLKAQELMAKHNVFVEESGDEIIEYAEEKCDSKWNMGFRKPLGHVIAKNFRCEMYIHNNSVVFMGRALDARIAREAFEYAYQFAMTEGNKVYNRAYSLGTKTKGIFNSYTLGFIRGIGEKFDEQCTALMIITPPDVKERFEDMTKGWKTSNSGMRLDTINRGVYEEGRRDGKTILNGRRIEA